MYDLKHMEPAQHKKLTGVDNALILANLSWLLNNDCKVRVRTPLFTFLNLICNHHFFVTRWGKIRCTQIGRAHV